MLSNHSMAAAPNSIEKATEALRAPDFNIFFQELEKITDKNQQRGFITYAVDIAAEQKSVPILSLLAKKWMLLCYEAYGGPLSKIIQTLIAMSRPDADDAAISLVTLYANENESYGSSLWLVLCQSFLENKNIAHVKMLYRYLENDREKRQVASAALEQCSITDDFSAWFAWFVRYLETSQAYSYYDSDVLSQKALTFILEYADFSQLVPHIFVANTSKAYEKFIIQLFCQTLFLEKSDKTMILLRKAPASLAWMQDVFKAINDESAYAIFANAEFLKLSFEIQDRIIVIALMNFFSKHHLNPIEAVAEMFLNRINLAPAKKDFMLEQFCEICCVNQRSDIALYLLRKAVAPKSEIFKEIALPIVQTKLSNDDYDYIVQGLDAWPDDIRILSELSRKNQENTSYRLYGSYYIKETITILIKIPRQIVLAENARRIQQKIEEHNLRKQKKEAEQADLRGKLRLLPDNTIPQRHEHYSNLVTQIEFYMKENQPKDAFAYIKKIVSSKYRDEYLKQAAVLFFDLDMPDLAQSACNLLSHASVQWKEWPRKMQSERYLKTLNWLVSESDFNDVKLLVQCYVHKMFSNIQISLALDYLFASKIFLEKKLDLEVYYADKKNSDWGMTDVDDMWTDVDSDIISVTSGADQNQEKQPLEEMIISRFIMQYADSTKLIKKMGDFKRQGITGFETAILNYHLVRMQWQNAIRLINLFSEKDDSRNANFNLGYIPTIGSFTKTVIDFFKTKVTLTELVLNRVNLITSQDLRARVLFVLLNQPMPDLYQDKNLVKLILKSINQCAEVNYQYELFNALLRNFLSAQISSKFVMIHDVIVKNVESSFLKNKLFMEYVFVALIYKSSLIKEIDIKYWAARIPFWYDVIVMVNLFQKNMLSDPFSLLHNIFEHRQEWTNPPDTFILTQVKELLNWVIEKFIQNKESLLKLSDFLYAQLDKSDKKSSWESDALIKKLYLLCIDKIVQVSKVDVNFVVPAIEHFEKIPFNDVEYYKFNLLNPIIENVRKMLDNSLQHNDAAAIKKTFIFISHAFKKDLYYSDHSLSNVLLALIKKDQSELLCELALLALSTHYNSIENSFGGVIKPICEYFINRNDTQKVMPFLNEVEKLFDSDNGYYHFFKEKKIRILITLAEKFATDDQLTQVRLIYHDHFKSVRRDLLAPLLDILIPKNHLQFAKDIILENGGDPQQILSYRKKIVAQHFVRLTTLIPDEYAKKLKEYYTDFVVFLHENNDANAKNHAIVRRNNLIVGLKNLLDKAFLAHYKAKELKSPPTLYAKIFSFPVPVNESFKGKEAKDKLNQFIHEYQFLSISQDLRQYLLDIQPSKDSSYQWLQQLRKMRNKETHDPSYLLPTLEVDGVGIDAELFLQFALTGIEKILVKLFNNTILHSELNNYPLSNLLILETGARHAAAHALGLEQDHALNNQLTVSAGYLQNKI